MPGVFLKKFVTFITTSLFLIQSVFAGIGADGRPSIIRSIATVDMGSLMSGLEDKYSEIASILNELEEKFELTDHSGEPIDSAEMLTDLGDVYFKTPTVEGINKRFGIIVSQEINEKVLQTGTTMFGLRIYSEDFERMFAARP